MCSIHINRKFIFLVSSTITSGEASGHEVVISRNRPTCCCILFDVTWLLVGQRVLPFSSFSACISSMLFCQPQILVRQCQNWITSISSFLLLNSRSECWALSTELLSGSALALHKRSGLCLTDLHATSIDPSLHGQ